MSKKFKGRPVIKSFSERAYPCKTVLLGESAVGKSCLVLKFVHEVFHDFQEPTIGAAFMNKTVTVANQSPVKFEIWDTAGQERYNSLIPMYYRGAKAAIVVYDVTNTNTFDKAQHWIKELQKLGRKDVIIVLVGNKSDLEEDKAIQYEDAELYAKEQNLIFIETSAKTGENINKLFFLIAENLLASGESKKEVPSITSTGNVQVKEEKSNFPLKNCC